MRLVNTIGPHQRVIPDAALGGFLFPSCVIITETFLVMLSEAKNLILSD